VKLKEMKNLTKTIKNDAELLESIKERIKWDSRLSNSDVIIKVKNSSVEVMGVFESATRKRAIGYILRTTKGVAKFSDYTNVIPSRKRSDTEIQKILSKKINDFYLFDGEWIDIKVSKGEVLYQGVVYRKNLKAFASRMAWELSGVNDCTNLIKIKRPPLKKAGFLYLAIPAAA
jgi:osmotically-inducible protein OsmY